MNTKDYIPKREEDFFYWQKNFITTITNYGAEDYMPPASYHELMRLNDDYEKKYAITADKSRRTSVTILSRQEARAVYEKYTRKIAQTYLVRNPDLTNSQKLALGLHVPKTYRNPSPVATESPDVNVDTSILGRLLFRYYERGHSHRKAKPEGQHGIEFVWVQSDVKPTRWEELIHSSVSTKSPLILEFENDMRGKTIYFALRWENTRGQKGPWTEILSSIIP
ncbi:MAG: hypothetical protein LBJ17_07110 [Dysgonamonadaceae bacterium]|jgi:hypothetical protein|nr:hypothetical protein [Dysgonamonadaceae bacterium]